MKRLPSLRAILIALIALQVVVMTPVSMMSTMAFPIASADCDDQHGSANDCPCCPAALASPGGCATFCLAAFAPPPAAALLTLQAALSAPPGSGALPFASQTYSPVNPPPIR